MTSKIILSLAFVFFMAVIFLHLRRKIAKKIASEES
jgi:hypothetical protein